jgi:hypothetical protein
LKTVWRDDVVIASVECKVFESLVIPMQLMKEGEQRAREFLHSNTVVCNTGACFVACMINLHVIEDFEY